MFVDNEIFNRDLKKKFWFIRIDVSLWNIIIDNIGILRVKPLHSMFVRKGRKLHLQLRFSKGREFYGLLRICKEIIL